MDQAMKLVRLIELLKDPNGACEFIFASLSLIEV